MYCRIEADVEEGLSALCVFGNRPPQHAAFGNSISVLGCHVSSLLGSDGVIFSRKYLQMSLSMYSNIFILQNRVVEMLKYFTWPRTVLKY
jgi:hypothetical protein